MKNEKREEVTLMKREKTEVQLKTKKGNLIKKRGRYIDEKYEKVNLMKKEEVNLMK